MPASRAQAIASSAARVSATGPGAACASTMAIAARGRSTVTAASATDSPLSNSSRYRGTRDTPCESTPRRLAQTSASATVAASASLGAARREDPGDERLQVVGGDEHLGGLGGVPGFRWTWVRRS